MIQSHNKKLYDELFTEIARMHDEVNYLKHQKRYQGRKGNRRHFPAVSVGAEYKGCSSIGHHHDKSSSQDFHPSIMGELEHRLGKLNKNSINYPACKNKVGHCAENYAASGVLNKIDANGKVDFADYLSSIQFTKSFQPRTWKNIDWCMNCHTMFD